MPIRVSGVPVSNYNVSRKQEGSTQVSGNYSLQLNGSYVFEGAHGSNDSLISYERSGWDLQWYLRRTFQQFDFEVNSYRRSYDGRNFTVSFVGHRGDLPEVLQTENFLKGGLNDRPELTSWVIQEGSTRPLFEPVPADMLRVRAAAPQVVVSVRGLESSPVASDLTLQSARYEVRQADTVVLTSFTYADGTLELEHSASALVVADRLEVSFAESPCAPVTVVSPTTLSCPVSGGVVGGNAETRPVVNIRDFGFFDTSSVGPRADLALVHIA